ncbi:MAG TPA: hypothetical protein PKN44_15910 [Bacteroidales bacterium]|nr:hypothetical protein [Bacteroidales bacterium]
MNTQLNPNTRTVITIVISIFCTIVSTTMIRAQPFQLNGSLPGNTLYQSSPKVGLGTTDLRAYFHIQEPISNDPVMKIEANAPAGGTIANLDFFGQRDGSLFGLYQQGDFPNYFEGDIGCQSSLLFNGMNSTFNIKNQDNGFYFHYEISAPGAKINTPLRINYGGITVEDLMECNSIQIHNNARDRRILVSDENGSGTWTDPSEFNDQDWLETSGSGGDEDDATQKSLYANPKYVNIGIGTNNPLSKLHMVDGNIMISRSPSEAPGSKNGSILFGEVISNLCPNGEWGIEYYSDERGYNAGGLNFWKVYTEGNGNPGADHCMFIRNDGNVGIATNQPMDRFQVNDGYEKTTIGSAIDFSTVSGTSYIGFNSARINKSNWTLSSNGTNNGGNLTFGDINGNYYIATIPGTENGTTSQTLSDDEVFSTVRLTVTGEGDVGIGTKETHGYKLAVQGKILCENLKVQLAEDWPVIPDFVFNKDYRLPSLKDIESYIKENNHLPGIPSAGEMKEQGIDMVEMNAQLLQKVEELTLYLIQQQKTIEQQQRQIDNLTKSINLR